jgi:hypothetical protein
MGNDFFLNPKALHLIKRPSMKLLPRAKLYIVACVLLILGSCGSTSSVTNVWDYYIKNNLDTHIAGKTIQSKSRILFRHQESPSKSQLEFIAYKNDSAKSFVIGSHKIAKAFVLYDSLYHFDVNDIYSHVRGNDFIRQMGDLSIYFTYIKSDEAELLLKNFESLRTKYNQLTPSQGTSSYIDYTISKDVFISLEKTNIKQQLKEVTLWVGKRKHSIDADDLVKALQDFKSFN